MWQKTQMRIFNRKHIAVIAACFLILLTSTSVFSSGQSPIVELTQEEQAYLNDKKQLTFVCDPAWPPYEHIDENHKYVGIAADYLQLFSEALGVPFKRIPTRSWLESVAIAKSGRSDFVSLLNRTPERERFLDFTEPYFGSQMVIIGKEDVWLDKGLTDIPNKTIAVVDGYWYTELMRNKFPQITRLRTQSVQEALQAVDKGKAYAFITTVIEASYYVRNNRLSELHIIGDTQHSNKLSVGVRKDEMVLLSIMQKAVDSITEVQKEQIRVKWLSNNVEELPVNYTIPAILIGFLLLVLVAGIYVYRKIY